jgi:hypothetical protein
MDTKFKVGDKVKIVSNSASHGFILGSVRIVDGVGGSCYHSTNESGYKDSGCYFYAADAVLISKKTTIMENLIKAWKNLGVTEPNKSQRAVGITDENDVVTTDGAKLFLSYLMGKDDGTFDKDVTFPLAKELEEKKD